MSAPKARTFLLFNLFSLLLSLYSVPFLIIPVPDPRIECMLGSLRDETWFDNFLQINFL